MAEPIWTNGVFTVHRDEKTREWLLTNISKQTFAIAFGPSGHTPPAAGIMRPQETGPFSMNTFRLGWIPVSPDEEPAYMMYTAYVMPLGKGEEVEVDLTVPKAS